MVPLLCPSHIGRLAALLLLTLSVVVSARPAFAQIQRPDEAPDPDAVPRVTGTYAIEDARIVVAPGQVIEDGTVVVRNGLIEAVGPEVAAPYDAARIAGDSLTVYAGFISGLSHAGIPKGGDNDGAEAEVERPGAPPADKAGLQPDRTARALLDPSEGTIADLREAGFTTAHTVPRGGMLPGRGAVILLAGESPGAMVLREDASTFAQFEGAGQVYPATDMAVIATMRQLLREAGRRQTLRRRYEKQPQGLSRPRYDDVHAALLPLLNGEKPLFFETEGALDIHRAIRLSEELDVPLALGGLQQSFAAVETLQALQRGERSVPLFLSLALPEPPDDGPALPTDSARADSVRPGPVADTVDASDLGVGQDTSRAVSPPAPGSPFIRDFRTRSYEDTDSERENLLARRALYAERYKANAATLSEAGLQFGFSTKAADADDLHDHLRTMVESGLPEEKALAALTTDAAQLLGLSRQLGTVEEGKIANLVVTSAPLFEDDATVRYVFVDGRRFEYEDAASDDDAEEGEVNPAGTWAYTISYPQGELSGMLQIEGAPGDLRGTVTGPDGEEQTLDNVSLSGSELSFEFDGGPAGPLSVAATVEGDEMNGTVTGPDIDSLPLEATRTATPD